MTEKRYKAIPETGEYKDTVTGEFLSPKFEEGFYKVLDLLNKNEELKKTNNKWMVDYNGLNVEYGWLKEENVQLKDEIRHLEEQNQTLKSELVHTKILLDSLQDNFSGLLKIVHGCNE